MTCNHNLRPRTIAIGLYHHYCEGLCNGGKPCDHAGPVIAAFYASNLAHVAKALRSRYPNNRIVIAGDDDAYVATRPETLGRNPGRDKALKAAELVNGKTVFPVFADADNNAESKEFTDFNDLINKSSQSTYAVARQVYGIIDDGELAVSDGG